MTCSMVDQRRSVPQKCAYLGCSRVRLCVLLFLPHNWTWCSGSALYLGFERVCDRLSGAARAQVYYVYGFMLLVFLFLIVVTSSTPRVS